MEAYKIIKESGQISHGDLVKKLGKRPVDVANAISEKLEGLISIYEQPLSIKYECKNNRCRVKRKGDKRPDNDDLEKLKQISQMNPAYYYPTNKLSYPSGKYFLSKRLAPESVDLFFTKRNLIALSILKHEIDELKVKSEIKETLLLGFVAILEHVSKMQRPSGKGLGYKDYYFPPTFLELNVLHAFKRRFKTIKLIFRTS